MKTKKLLRFLRIEFWICHPKAKERNSGVIMDELCVAVQVSFVGDRAKLLSRASTLAAEVPRS